MQPQYTKTIDPRCVHGSARWFPRLAILLVMAMHFVGFSAGWVGVDLFFVLSGFLITWKALGTARKIVIFDDQHD